MAEITQALQSLLVTVVVGAITILSGMAVAYIKVLKDKATKMIENMNNEEAQKILNEAVAKACNLVSSVVTSLEQEEKQAILEAIADGEVTKDELYKLKAIAIDKVVNQLGPDSIKILEDAFGDATEYIGDLVSSKVFELKLIKQEVSTISE